MKYLFYPFLILMAVINFSAKPVSPKDFSAHFRLLPEPQKLEVLQGKSLLPADLRFLFLSGTGKRPAGVESLMNLPLAEASGKGVLTLSLVTDSDLPESTEGYIMEIKNGQVNIRSRGEAGLFYGCQTLHQLMQDAKDQNIGIPACRITDFPGVPYRAVHLDLRFHLNPGNYFYELIDRLAEIKVNAIIVELEDKLRYEKVPVIGTGNSISIDEFAAISRYAKERNIDVSPLVQGLGHAGFILKHDQYKYLRDDTASDWAFDALNPDTYKVQFSMYEDAMKATPYGKYLHVGGDEVYNLGRSELAKKSGMKPVELQLYWLKKVTEFAVQHGRIPITWDDMPFSLAGLTGTMRSNAKGLTNDQIEQVWKDNQYKIDDIASLFPTNCVYMRWTYWNTKVLGNLKAIDWLLSKNLTVMGATGAQDMSPLLPRNNSIFPSIKDFCQIATEKKLPGILCTMWDDSSYSFETFWRGIYIFASMSWDYKDVKPEAFNSDFRHRFYAPELSDVSCEFQNLLEMSLWFWDGALINNSTYARHISKEGVYNPYGDRGDRGVYPKSINLISLPDKEKPGEWSEKYKEKIAVAHGEMDRYGTIRERIAKAKKMARRNQYSLDLMDAINEFQVYSTKLILLFEKYDRGASSSDKKAAADEIKDYVNSFSGIRANLENVISEKRFLKNQEGYVRSVTADLSNGGIDNEWMFLHETPMNEKIKEWLAE